MILKLSIYSIIQLYFLKIKKSRTKKIRLQFPQKFQRNQPLQSCLTKFKIKKRNLRRQTNCFLSLLQAFSPKILLLPQHSPQKRTKHSPQLFLEVLPLNYLISLFLEKMYSQFFRIWAHQATRGQYFRELISRNIRKTKINNLQAKKKRKILLFLDKMLVHLIFLTTL